jgi:hypothetical protein
MAKVFRIDDHEQSDSKRLIVAPGLDEEEGVARHDHGRRALILLRHFQNNKVLFEHNTSNALEALVFTPLNSQSDLEQTQHGIVVHGFHRGLTLTGARQPGTAHDRSEKDEKKAERRFG